MMTMDSWMDSTESFWFGARTRKVAVCLVLLE